MTSYTCTLQKVSNITHQYTQHCTKSNESKVFRVKDFQELGQQEGQGQDVPELSHNFSSHICVGNLFLINNIRDQDNITQFFFE